MPDTLSPGQRCFEAYSAALGLTYPQRWADVAPTRQAAWDAAAQAVLATKLRDGLPPVILTPAQGIDAIRALVGHYFDGVDVEAYVQELRR